MPRGRYADILEGPVTAMCYQELQDPTFNCPGDVLQLLSQPETAPFQSTRWATILLQISVYGFPIFSIVSSIPVFSIIIKYNVVENGLSPRVGFLWGVVFPWLAGFPLLYMPDVLGRVINITSLIFVSFANFILPLALYVVLQRQGPHIRPSLGTTLLPADHSQPQEGREHAAVGEAFLFGGGATLGVQTDGGGGACTAAEEAPTAGGLTHHALPRSWAWCTPRTKSVLATALAIILALGSATALVLTIIQGSYTIDASTCATVGN